MYSKRKSLGVLLIALLVVFVPAGTASAHVLATDGTIGAVLHLDPDDRPVSNAVTNYELSFSDTDHKLALTDCDCMVTIQENGKTIANNPLDETNDHISLDSFTFPKADVYNLIITGAPRSVQSFQPFRLTYLVRVSPGESKTQHTPLILWIGMGGLVGLVLLMAYKMQTSYSRDNVKQRSK